MKKLILLFLLHITGDCTAQSLTINNATSCSVSYSVTGSDIGTCNAAYNSTGPIAIPAGGSVIHSNTLSLSWNTPPPINIKWAGISILDDGQMKLTDDGDACAFLSSTSTYTSPCNGAMVTVTWTGSGDGSATVDIR
jgi:hypothetical protein